MRRAIDHEKLWANACRLATQDLEIDGPVEELVGGTVDPRGLASRLSAALAPLERTTGA